MANGIEVNDGVFLDALRMDKKAVGDAAQRFVRQGGEVIAGNARKQFIGGKEAQATDSWRSDAWPIPTRRTGQLQNSIRVSKVYKQGSFWVSETGPTTVYGRRVELGYTGTGHFPYYTTRSFPYMRPGLEDSKDELTRLYASLIGSAQQL